MHSRGRALSFAGRTNLSWQSTPIPLGNTTTRPFPRRQQNGTLCSMCGPKFCSMEITQQVREMAETAATEAVIREGLDAQSAAFRRAAVYVDEDGGRPKNAALGILLFTVASRLVRVAGRWDEWALHYATYNEATRTPSSREISSTR